MDTETVRRIAERLDTPQRGPRARDHRGRDKQAWVQAARDWRNAARDDLEE